MSEKKKSLKDLKNVGKQTLKDLEILGIHSVSDLALQDPIELFRRLENETGTRHDPCMLDVFFSSIHEAKTGTPTSWWEWTPKRKALS